MAAKRRRGASGSAPASAPSRATEEPHDEAFGEPSFGYLTLRALEHCGLSGATSPELDPLKAAAHTACRAAIEALAVHSHAKRVDIVRSIRWVLESTGARAEDARNALASVLAAEAREARPESRDPIVLALLGVVLVDARDSGRTGQEGLDDALNGPWGRLQEITDSRVCIPECQPPLPGVSARLVAAALRAPSGVTAREFAALTEALGAPAPAAAPPPKAGHDGSVQQPSMPEEPLELTERAVEAAEWIEKEYRRGHRVPTKVFTQERSAHKHKDWPTWTARTVRRVYEELIRAGVLRRDGRFYVRAAGHRRDGRAGREVKGM